MAGHTAPAQICLKNPYLGNCINAEIGYQCLLLTRLAMNAKSLSQTWHLTMGELVLMDLAGEEQSEAFCMAKKGYWLTWQWHMGFWRAVAVFLIIETMPIKIVQVLLSGHTLFLGSVF